MGTVVRSSSTPIDASVDDVWKVLADGFLDISRWAGDVTASGPNPNTPDGFQGSPHGGRVCEVDGVGSTDERIVAFDADAHSLSYTVQASGLPFFVSGLRNTWSVRPDGLDKSVVDVEFRASTKGIIGALGSLPLGRMLGKATVGLPRDLRTHIMGER